MRRNQKQIWQTFARSLFCATLIFVSSRTALAQSSDLSSPTPVFNGEVNARISALDVGDARLTRHFYTFNARPGDLEVTIEVNNLEGDIDLFTAGAMRPLAKVTLFAGLNSTIARTVFFRRGETLILRVQARTPNDADGSYRIHLGSTFAASTMSATNDAARNAESASAASREKPADRNTRRVNSVGARIEEPKPDVAIEPVTTTPVETARTNEPTPAKAITPKTNAAKGRTTRREPARRGAVPRSASQSSAASGESGTVEPGKSETAGTNANPATAGSEPATTGAGSSRTRNNRTRPPRTGVTGTTNKSGTTNAASTSNESPTSSSAEPASSAAPALGLEAPGSRLVLELRGGERIVREMSEVRRVAVEGRLIVIVLKNGRIERQPLTNVTRMTIEP